MTVYYKPITASIIPVDYKRLISFTAGHVYGNLLYTTKLFTLIMSNAQSKAQLDATSATPSPKIAIIDDKANINTQAQEKSNHKAIEKAKDLELVKIAQSESNESKEALNSLIHKYYKRAVNIAYGIVKDSKDAEDVAQEAFVKVYKNLEKFEGQSAFYTWLYRIVTNSAIDLLRKKKRKPNSHFETEQAFEAVTHQEKSPTAIAQSPFNPQDISLERKEQSKLLKIALDKLSEEHQKIIILREVEGLSYDDIAEIIGTKKGTVMSRLFHARKQMQHHLLKLGIDKPKLKQKPSHKKDNKGGSHV